MRNFKNLILAAVCLLQIFVVGYVYPMKNLEDLQRVKEVVIRIEEPKEQVVSEGPLDVETGLEKKKSFVMSESVGQKNCKNEVRVDMKEKVCEKLNKKNNSCGNLVGCVHFLVDICCVYLCFFPGMCCLNIANEFSDYGCECCSDSISCIFPCTEMARFVINN